MAEIENVLIVGGGISGTSLAVGLSALGLEVTLVEAEPEWGPLGVGITLQGPALRAFGQIGLLDPVVSAGVGIDDLHVGNACGEVLEVIPLTRMCGDAYPGTVTIRRPDLHTVLATAAADNAVRIRTGCTVASLAHHDHGVTVTFADGSTGEFDLVVGADGLWSQVRQLAFSRRRTAPEFTHQVVWRVMLPRHANVGERMMVFYGPTNKIGFSPMPPDEMYVFVVQTVPTRLRPLREELPALLAEQLSPYSGWLADIRPLIDPARIDYRPIDVILVPNPWYAGRVLLIGDAAHATTPHLASGATIAIEDAAVLTEMIAERPTDVGDLLARFMQRRFERCRMVVENGVQLGRWEQEPVDRTADAVELMSASFHTLAEPV
jgi:2-polyprenyl-6-methoxyphenol hydroxylase-like FAD-dependent oxidoreductase